MCIGEGACGDGGVRIDGEGMMMMMVITMAIFYLCLNGL